jgi:Skp family chaperone for outer membrane proteins
MNRKIFYFVIILLLSSVKSVLSENISYLDMNFLMNDSLAGKSIISEINSQKKTLSTKFDKEENNLRQKETKLISQKNLLKKDDFQSKIDSLKEDINKYNLNKKELINLLNKKKVTAENKLATIIRNIISEYAKENSVSLILHKNSIIIGKKELELTSVILKILDNKTKKIKIK